LRADELPRNEQSGSVSQRARQAYAAEALRQKDHVSAGLLAVFLGMFGVHKFYLGCNQAGFIMLAVSIIGGILTFGLAAAVIWLIAIIEGIIYLSKSQTEFDQLYVLNQRDWF
jgi:TM2 domain-containing membrane protein YozV